MTRDDDYRREMSPSAPAPDRPDPIELLIESGLDGDQPELVALLSALSRFGNAAAPVPSIQLAGRLRLRRIRPSRGAVAAMAATAAVLTVGVSAAAAAGKRPNQGSPATVRPGAPTAPVSARTVRHWPTSPAATSLPPSVTLSLSPTRQVPPPAEVDPTPPAAEPHDPTGSDRESESPEPSASRPSGSRDGREPEPSPSVSITGSEAPDRGQ